MKSAMAEYTGPNGSLKLALQPPPPFIHHAPLLYGFQPNRG